MGDARADCATWESATEGLLKRLFTTDCREREFTTSYSPTYDRNLRFTFNVDRYRRAVRGKISRLESILERLSQMPESVPPPMAGGEPPRRQGTTASRR